MKSSWLLAAPFALALASPAMAVGFCNDHSGGFSIVNGKVTAGFHIGEEYTEEEQGLLDQIQLRRMGVEATRVERWNGCLRAWVKGDDGSEHQQFFDPNNYDRLDLRLR